MDIFLLILFSLIILFFLYLSWIKKITLTTFHISNLVFILIVVAFVTSIVAFPKECFSAASSGLNLWFNVVFPSLLPFLICSELLIGLGFVNFLGTLFEPFMRKLFNVPGAGSFALAMGLTSGYPTGSKITASLREKNLCTKVEGERLLTFTNNSGPLFIIGAVSVGMFNNPVLGYILAIAHYTAALTVGILFRFYKIKYSADTHKKTESAGILRKAAREMFNARRNDGRSIGTLLGDSIKNAINLLLLIGGFIILFSVILSLLNKLNVISSISYVLAGALNGFGIDISIINSVLSGLFEITNGCNLAAASKVIYIQKVLAAAFILGWAGLSVHMQVISIIGKTDISPVPYLCAKLCHGVIAAVYTYILFSYISLFEASAVFKPIMQTSSSWFNYFIGSSEFMLGIFIILIFTLLVVLLIRNFTNLYKVHH